MTKRKTLEETLKEAKGLADEDEELEAALAKTDEQLTRELEAEGVNVDAMVARMEAKEKAALAALPNDTKPAAGGNDVTRVLTRRQGIQRFVAGFAVAAAMAAAHYAYVVANPGPGPIATGDPNLHPPSLRDRAFAECGRQHWARCLEYFDQARDIDPAGDADPEVQNARDAAYRALRPDDSDASVVDAAVPCGANACAPGLKCCDPARGLCLRAEKGCPR